MSGRTDRVEMLGGVVHLPAEFREVARLANRAGLEGFEFVDAEVGIDPAEIRATLGSSTCPTSRIVITYRQEAGRRFEIDESERQALLLSLALCSLLRPGWDMLLSEIAVKFFGRDLFAEFKRLNSDRCKPQLGPVQQLPGTEPQLDPVLQLPGAGPDLRDALERSLQLQAHYATLLNQWDRGSRSIFHSVDEWLANLERLRRKTPGMVEDFG